MNFGANMDPLILWFQDINKDDLLSMKEFEELKMYKNYTKSFCKRITFRFRNYTKLKKHQRTHNPDYKQDKVYW